MKNFILEMNAKVVADSQRLATIERKYNDLCKKHNSEDNVILVVDTRTSDVIFSNDSESADIYC